MLSTSRRDRYLLYSPCRLVCATAFLPRLYICQSTTGKCRCPAKVCSLFTTVNKDILIIISCIPSTLLCMLFLVCSIPAITEEQARECLLEYVGQQCCYGKAAAQDFVFARINPSSAFHVSPFHSARKE